MNRLLSAAALALTVGMATVPAFAKEYSDDMVCLNAISGLYKNMGIVNPDGTLKATWEMTKAEQEIEQDKATRMDDAARLLNHLASKHLQAFDNGKPIVDRNDPDDMTCAEAVKLAHACVDGK